jgi:hypothetical protein
MDTKTYLENEFLTAWKEKTGKDFPISLNEVSKAFSITRVDENVNRQINESADRLFSERYQRTTLRTVTKLYVDKLYEASSFGRSINENSIQQAKINLKNQRMCEVQPC